MLKLLLDEHISPGVAAGMRRCNSALLVYSMVEWEGGCFLGQDDAVCLQAASMQRVTLVTYDQRTITPLLKRWAEEARPHAGVIFIDEKTIYPSDIGGLVKALGELVKETRAWDWTNRVVFL
ncbi:MAG: hypothetical protein FWD64_04750 [Acidobacteriaceae bacterium]|nr:hypothetical protein [Acidobacteriaceae bacterium]